MKRLITAVASGTALHALGALTSVQSRIARRLLPADVRDPSGLIEPSQIRSVLVVRLDETIGDTVMFSPFLRELRRDLPDAKITLVVNSGRRDMYQACPYVDRLVTTTLGCAADRRVLTRPIEARRLIEAELADEHFDIAFVPRVDYDHHSVFIAAASGASIRLGYSAASTERKALVSRGIDRLLTHPVAATPQRHESDRALDLLGIVGLDHDDASTEVWVPDEAREHAAQFLDERGVGDFVVIAPTGGHSDLKMWPTERYVDVAEALLARGHDVVVVGGPPDLALLDEFPADLRDRLHVAIGELSVTGAIALIDRATGFVGADSGMSHVAAAVGCHVVSVFGPTCTHVFSPRGPHSQIISLGLACSPCAQHDGPEIDRCATCIFDEPRCMSGVTSDVVLAATSSW